MKRSKAPWRVSCFVLGMDAVCGDGCGYVVGVPLWRLDRRKLAGSYLAPDDYSSYKPGLHVMATVRTTGA